VKITNYGTLKTALADFAERGDLTTQLPYFVDYAQQEIARNLRASVNTVAADITISSGVIAVPSDYQAIRRLYLSTTPVRTIAICSPETLAEVNAEFSTGTYPTHVSVQGSNFWFAPNVGATYTGKLLYWATPAAMSNDSDTNAVLTEYPFLYLYGALAELFRFMVDPRADQWEQRFQGLLADINKSEAYDALAGSIQGRPSTGII
jgi:hypothetical protein